MRANSSRAASFLPKAGSRVKPFGQSPKTFRDGIAKAFCGWLEAALPTPPSKTF